MNSTYKTLALLLALGVNHCDLFSQSSWSWQNPLPQGNKLRSVRTTSQNGAIAVGEAGTIIRTTDGGSSWKISMSGTSANLHGVSFADDNNGWAVGGGFGQPGTIIYSNNGGINWQVQLRDSFVYEIRAVHFINSSIGVAFGGQYCFRTTNGGTIWSKKPISQISNVYGVFFTSPDTGYVVGTYQRQGFFNANGVILKTTDACTTWVLQDSVESNFGTASLNDIQFINSTTGLIVGEGGVILKTSNAGTNWTRIQAGINDPLAQVCWMNNSTPVAVSASNFFWSSSGGGKIYRSTDAGSTWSSAQSGANKWLYGVTSTGSGNGIAVGEYGTLMATTNAGLTWSSMTTGSRSILFDVKFTSPTNAFIAGENGTILNTSDGGTTWVNQVSGTTNLLKGIDFVDQLHGTAVGDSGTILRTTNGGISWNILQMDKAFGLNAVCFTDMNNGYAVGWDPSIVGGGAVLYQTTNGGGNWNFQQVTPNKYLSMVTFVTKDIGCIVGGNSFTNGGSVLRTTNGGLSWTEQTVPQNNGLFDISFANAEIGFAVGVSGCILRTNDGGISWNKQLSGTFFDLHGVVAVDTSVAYAVSERTMLKTTNGGNTWVLQPLITSNLLLAVSFTDTATGTVVGAGGTILRFAKGNTSSVQKEFEQPVVAPKGISLGQNYPNPFNPSTNIQFTVHNAGVVTLKIFSIIGIEVATLVEGMLKKGQHEFTWNAEGVSSGVYFYRLTSGSICETKKLMVLR